MLLWHAPLPDHVVAWPCRCRCFPCALCDAPMPACDGSTACPCFVLLQVSKYRSMNVSTMTDARVHSNYVIQTGEVPVRHSHEEYMDVSAPAQLL